MADRDEQRPAAGLAAEHRADDLAFVPERAHGARLLSREGEAAEQARLGDTDSGTIGQETEMAGEADATRVCTPLAVHHHEIDGRLQHHQGGHRRGHLAKRKEARSVGKGDGQRRLCALHDLQRRRIEEHRGGESGAPVPGEVDVDTGDPPRREAFGRLFHDLAAKGFLNQPRLG